MKKIAHLTSVHSRFDTRIFIKECQSLSTCFQVHLIVADGKGDEIKNNIAIHDVGKTTDRIKRILHTTRLVLKKAITLDADIYHLHDPELIPIGLKLLKKGKQVIFDAHEDLPKQILHKPYLKPWQAKMLAVLIQRFEQYALAKYSAIVAATPYIRDKFIKLNNNVVDINNFPRIEEFSITGFRDQNRKTTRIEDESPILVCYVGGLSRTRGIKEIVQAQDLVTTKVRLQLAGSFSETEFENEVRQLSAWKNVQELGFVDRKSISNILHSSIAGIVTLYPIANYLDALPVKMFEYMSAGIPVIASDFPLWKKIIEGNQCGICVNPLSPSDIAQAIDFLANNPELAEQMGQNGREAVHRQYHWGIEEQKLLKFYEKIITTKHNKLPSEQSGSQTSGCQNFHS